MHGQLATNKNAARSEEHEETRSTDSSASHTSGETDISGSTEVTDTLALVEMLKEQNAVMVDFVIETAMDHIRRLGPSAPFSYKGKIFSTVFDYIHKLDATVFGIEDEFNEAYKADQVAMAASMPVPVSSVGLRVNLPLGMFPGVFVAQSALQHYVEGVFFPALVAAGTGLPLIEEEAPHSNVGRKHRRNDTSLDVAAAGGAGDSSSTTSTSTVRSTAFNAGPYTGIEPPFRRVRPRRAEDGLTEAAL